jgi:hypothetical protein
MNDVDAVNVETVLTGVTVDVAGVATMLVASDTRRADAVASLFRHARPTASPAICTLHFVDARLPLPETAPHSVRRDVDVWRLDGERTVLRTTDGLRACVTRDEVVVGGDAEEIDRSFRYIGFLALTSLLACQGRHLLHGAAVVADGGALVVVGGTGTGKSTLALAALGLGWRVLADDLVVLRSVDGVVHVRGIHRPIAVPREVLDDLGRGRRSVPNDPRARVELPADTLDAAEHRVGGVVVTGRSPDATGSITPLDAHDALRAVLGSSAALDDREELTKVLALAASLARMPAWSLAHGADPATRIADTARLLGLAGDWLRAGQS